MPANIGKLRFWKPIDLTNEALVAKRPITASLQRFRQRWLEFRNQHGISILSARIRAPQTVEKVSLGYRVDKCLSLISADLDHTIRENVNNCLLTRSIYDNRRAAGVEIDCLAETINDMPPRLFQQHLEDQLKGLPANQLQQLRKNAAILFRKGGVTMGAGASDPNVAMTRKAILDSIHATCNKLLMTEKGYASQPALIKTPEKFRVN